MELVTNGTSREVPDLQTLDQHLGATLRVARFAEVWLHSSSGWPAICALINGEAAWLMYLRFEGDSGFSTRNPTYSGPTTAVTEYYLSNGQRDEYPTSWSIGTPEAVRALKFFFENEEMAFWLPWVES